MNFVLLIYQGTTPLPNTPEWDQLSEGDRKAVYRDYAAVNQTPGVALGLPLGLPGAARTVVVKNGQPTVKMGTHLAEGLGGYMILEAENVEAAIELAARIPAARLGGAVEVRPAERYW